MKIIALLLIFCFPILIFGQSQNPSTVKFKKLESEHFEIIFDENISATAQDIANKLETQYLVNTKRLKFNPPKISLVLYNQSVTSNAYAGIAPRKMGWYITPMQSSMLGISNWFTTLSIHEYSHVIQYNKCKNHFTLLASILFGDYGQAALQYSTPAWFFEGDAVYSETINTSNGRGRVSTFTMPERTILLTDQKFSYDKAFLGSYKNYYPNYYYLGYNMVTHVYRNYGADVFSKIINRTSKYSYYPFVFSKSLKKITGNNLTQTYKNTMTELKYSYQKQAETMTFTDATIVNKTSKYWKNYSDIDFLNNDTLIAIKYGLNYANQLVYVTKDGNETKIKNVDAEFISISKHKVIWSTETPDIRWGEQSYSNISVLDLNTNKITELTKKTKYFAPQFSNDGTKIAVVEYTTDLKCSLLILDAQTGKELKRFESKNNDFLRLPAWSADDKYITYCNLGETGQALSYINTNTGEVKEVLTYSWENFSNPIFWNNFIIYNSDYSGVGNIYAVDINTNQKYQITSQKYGAYNPKVSADGKNLVFQDYDETGYNIAIIDLIQSNWTKIEKVYVNKVENFDFLENKENIKNIFTPEQITKSSYEVKNYNEMSHLINIHSWSIIPDLSLENIKFTVYSTNKLNTLNFSGGMNYNNLSGANYEFLNASYQKYFPIINLSAQSGRMSEVYDKNLSDNNLDSIDIWFENAINLGITIPLNFSKGVFARNLNFGLNLGYKDVKNRDLSYLTQTYPTTEVLNNWFSDINYFLDFSNYKYTSRRAVRTRVAQTFSVSYTHTPFNQNLNGEKLYLASDLYFPGLMKNHSLKLSMAYEKQTKLTIDNYKNTYYYASNIGNIRGYSFGFYESAAKVAIDYKLPLFCPDLALGSLVNIKRVKMLAFFDMFASESQNITQNNASTGLQLLFDLNIFRLPYDFELGVEGAFLLNESKIVYSPVVMGISF